MTCKWINLCPLRKFEREGKIGNSWAKNYCESSNNWEKCKRYQLEERGIFHPDNMLPNGEIDESIGRI